MGQTLRASRLLFAVVAVVTVGVALVGCGSSKTPVEQANSDAAAVSTDVNAYLALYSESPATVEAWQSFVTRAQGVLTRVQASFNKWSADLDHVDASQKGYPEMLAYRSAASDWVSEQERQASASQACLAAGLSRATLTCYQELARSSAASGEAASSRLQQAQQQLQAALGR